MILHPSRSCAFLTQFVPATATISSAHLTGGLLLDLQLVLDPSVIGQVLVIHCFKENSICPIHCLDYYEMKVNTFKIFNFPGLSTSRKRHQSLDTNKRWNHNNLVRYDSLCYSTKQGLLRPRRTSIQENH